MSQPQQTVLLDAPKEVSLADLERDLTQLWKEAESGSEEGFHPVVRACTMNLIVVTEDETGMDTLGTMVGEVTLEHPARIFLAVLARGAKEASLNSWISARCAIRSRMSGCWSLECLPAHWWIVTSSTQPNRSLKISRRRSSLISPRPVSISPKVPNSRQSSHCGRQ